MVSCDSSAGVYVISDKRHLILINPFLFVRQILCVLGILQIINDFCPHFTGMTQTLRWGKSHKHINSSLGSLEEEQSVIFTSSLLDCEIKTVKHVDQTAKLKHKGQKGEKSQ